MQEYIGVKKIKARAMSRGDYNKLRGWEVPHDENPEDAGFLVEYVDGGKANVPGFAGYVSWSPADVFSRAYHLNGGLTFGDAIEALKAGYRVARSGWNGKGMWLSLSHAQTREVPADAFWSSHNALHAIEQGGTAKVLPSITMKTASGEILVGWLASQTDMLANDWVVL